MTSQMILRGAFSGMVFCLNACASPHEHFYMLDQPPPTIGTLVQKDFTVLVGPVLVPAEVDRPQIVVRKGAYEVVIKEQARWAASLKEALPRLLASDLSRNSKNIRFVPQTSIPVSTAKAQLAFEITRLEMSYEAGASVSLHWRFRWNSKDRPPVEGDAVALSSITRPGIEGLLDAVRRAFAEAATSVADQLPGL